MGSGGYWLKSLRENPIGNSVPKGRLNVAQDSVLGSWDLGEWGGMPRLTCWVIFSRPFRD